MSTEIAQTILQQIGGRKFIAMTGAKNLIAHDNALSFKLPKYAGVKINYIKITLNAMDTYDVEFKRVWGHKVEDIETLSGVYNMDIERIISETTGLATRL